MLQITFVPKNSTLALKSVDQQDSNLYVQVEENQQLLVRNSTKKLPIVLLDVTRPNNIIPNKWTKFRYQQRQEKSFLIFLFNRLSKQLPSRSKESIVMKALILLSCKIMECFYLFHNKFLFQINFLFFKLLLGLRIGTVEGVTMSRSHHLSKSSLLLTVDIFSFLFSFVLGSLSFSDSARSRIWHL